MDLNSVMHKELSKPLWNKTKIKKCAKNGEEKNCKPQMQCTYCTYHVKFSIWGLKRIQISCALQLEVVISLIAINADVSQNVR